MTSAPVPGHWRSTASRRCRSKATRGKARCKACWHHDRDVENIIRNDIDDLFFEELLGRREFVIDPAVLNAVVDDVLGFGA